MIETLSSISSEPIDPFPLEDFVLDSAHGALLTFRGIVRNHDRGEAVTALEYSAHPDAAAVLERIAAAAAQRADVLGVAVSHRIGRLEVGEAALVVAVATAHRELAFEVCRALVERVKAELPIWKREILADGTHVWVGSA